MKLVRVKECDVANCSYNRNLMCSALAITVGASPHPVCDTFMLAQEKGGVANAQAGVGACKVATCKYNQSFECTAEAIKVDYHERHADCSTFEEK